MQIKSAGAARQLLLTADTVVLQTTGFPMDEENVFLGQRAYLTRLPPSFPISIPISRTSREDPKAFILESDKATKANKLILTYLVPWLHTFSDTGQSVELTLDQVESKSTCGFVRY